MNSIHDCVFVVYVQMLDTSAREEFFEQTLPAIVTLALRLPILCTQVSDLITVLLHLTISLPDIYLKQQEAVAAACMYWLISVHSFDIDDI